MKRVTELYKKCFSVDRKTGEKTYLNPKLSKEELTFLYEIDNPIDGFGYQKTQELGNCVTKENHQKMFRLFLIAVLKI